MQEFLEFLLKSISPHPLVKNKPRKLELQPFCILRGALRVGKSTLAISQNANLKTLFIDWEDIRVQLYLQNHNYLMDSFFMDFNNALLENCKKQEIKVLIFKQPPTNYPLALLKREKYFQKITLISNTIPTLEGFSVQTLMPIDFEEFLSFGRIYNNLSQSFNVFIKDGNLPEISLNEQKDKIKQDILRILCYKYGDTFIKLIPYLGQKISTYQIFTRLKQKCKISKDSLYSLMDRLCKELIILTVPKFESPNAPKKIFFWDFSLKSYVSFQRDFISLFENCVFLELFLQQPIFYGDKIDFILPQQELGVLCIPFATKDIITQRLQKITKEREYCARFIIVTLNLQHKGTHLGSPFVALPFWEFALGK